MEKTDRPPRTTRWKITQTIERLQAAATHSPCADYSTEIRDQVLSILQLWDDTWTGVAPNYHSFLNKKSFQHEIEECLPALHHLNEWRKVNTTVRRFVAFDVCGGKGCFAMLLQYVASHYWNVDAVDSSTEQRPVLDQVILLEKATRDEIDWYHLLHHPPATATAATSPVLIPLALWDGCNLHETDTLVDRIRDTVPYPIAATGIHLCKLLSPAMVSLVNLLGPEKCVYTCLVPCCMPRAVTKTAQRHLGKGNKHTAQNDSKEGVEPRPRQPSYVPVSTYETLEEREARLLRIQRRDAARRKRGKFNSRSDAEPNADHGLEADRKLLSSGCFCCQSTSHQLQFCPQVETLSTAERQSILLAAAPSLNMTPCWNCGIPGHYQADCPNDRIVTIVVSDNGQPRGGGVTSLIEPPRELLDVTNILDLADPMRAYCDLLLNAINALPTSTTRRDGSVATISRAIWETTLVNTKAENQPAANWNGGRKSLYLVVYLV